MRIVIAVVALLLLVAASMGTWWNAASTTNAAEDNAPVAEEPATLEVGDAAPAFKLQDSNGKWQALADQRDKKVVLLSFSSVTCPVCVEAAPAHARIYSKFKGNSEFAMWGLYGNAKSAADLKKYAANNKLRFPQLLDPKSKTRTAYHVDQTPTFVLVGKDGVVRAIYSGWSADTEADTVAQVEDALAGKPVEPPPADLEPGYG